MARFFAESGWLAKCAERRKTSRSGSRLDEVGEVRRRPQRGRHHAVSRGSARNPNTRNDVAQPQDAKPRARQADDQICLGQRNDAALSNHANPQKTGRQPSALFSSQKSQAVKPFLVCCCPLCFLCLLSDRLKLAFINAIYFKKGTGKRGAATAAGEQRRQGSSSKGSICADDTQTRIFGKQQEQQIQQQQQQMQQQMQQQQ